MSSKVVLVGAGSLQFGAGMLGDLFQSRVFSDCEILLHDINPTAVEKTLALARTFCEQHNLQHRLSASTDLGSVLPGADFVVISIEVGDRFELWNMDWQIPRQYGIQQIYGENGGPGGLFHSLRIIPPILDICAQIAEHAPSATVFNYSNPMSRICTTVQRRFPALKFIGMCHEIASLARHLPVMLDTPLENLRYRAAGLNHFSVMLEASYVDSGKDAYPAVRERAAAYFGNMIGYSEILQASRKSGKTIETEGWMQIEKPDEIGEIRPWSDRHLFRDILSRFGYLPITYDSHFGEYLQWAHDCADHRGIVDFYSYYRNFLGNTEPQIKLELHERVVPIMEALVTGNEYEEAAVNIPNNGFIRCLPDWLAVEVPAIVGSQGIRGIEVEMPAGIGGLLTNQIGIHDLTAEAVLQQSRDLVIQALLVDPVVTVSRPIPALVEHMIAEQSPWLDYLR